MGKYLGKTRHLRIGLIVGSLAAVAIGFQNCGKAGFESAEEDIASTAKPVAPFVFEAEMDQISYNSCFGNSSVPTIMAGAYDNTKGAGVKINLDEFRKITGEDRLSGESINGMLKPLYPDKYITSLQFRKFISEDARHKGTQPQLAVRFMNNLGSVLQASEQTAQHANMLGDLTDDRFLSQIVGLDPVDLKNTQSNLNTYQLRTIASKGKSYLNQAPVTHFPLVPADTVVSSPFMDGKLAYNSNELMADNVRSALNSNAILALTFLSKEDGADEHAMIKNELGKPYGRGYRLGFGSSWGRPGSKPDILASVSEMNFLNQTVDNTKSWTCGGASQVFFIVRKSDVKNYNNSAAGKIFFQSHAESIQRTSNSVTKALLFNELYRVRRHFTASQWDVGFCSTSITSLSAATSAAVDGSLNPPDNTTFRCAIDLGVSCYSHVTAEMGIQYSPVGTCFSATAGGSYLSNTNNWCMPAISICNRD